VIDDIDDEAGGGNPGRTAAPAPVDPDDLPTDLKVEPRWVAWQLVPRPGRRPNKVPVNPRTGRHINPHDPDSWLRFEEALAATAHPWVDGIGIALDGDGLAGLDLDEAVRPDGSLTPGAHATSWPATRTYAELSPSGDGLRLFLRTAWLPEAGCETTFRGAKVEAYARDRYLTVTGRVYGHPRGVEHRTEAFKSLHHHLFPQAAPPTSRPTRPVSPAELGPAPLEAAPEAAPGVVVPEAVTLSDDEILATCSRWALFDRLYGEQTPPATSPTPRPTSPSPTCSSWRAARTPSSSTAVPAVGSLPQQVGARRLP
jgi:hypothetical protein